MNRRDIVTFFFLLEKSKMKRKNCRPCQNSIFLYNINLFQIFVQFSNWCKIKRCTISFWQFMRTKHLQILRKQEINGPLFGNTAAIPNIFGFYRRTSFSCKSNVCFLCAFLLVVVFWMKFNMFIKPVVSLFKMRWHELQCEDNVLSFFIIFLIIIQRHTDVTKRIVWQLYQCKEKKSNHTGMTISML